MFGKILGGILGIVVDAGLTTAASNFLLGGIGAFIIAKEA